MKVGEDEPELRSGYVKTKPKENLGNDEHGVFALDCEMSYTTIGMELTRVTVLDAKCKTVYDKVVKPPNPILDYNTKFSGLTATDFASIKTTLKDVQDDLLDLFSDKTILIGHSLDNDLIALKILHSTVIDTAHLYPHRRGLPFKRALATLSKEYLLKSIRANGRHDSKEDASVTLQLVLRKA